MIIPFQQDDALLDDIRHASTDAGTFHLWWLGQSGFLLKWQHHHLLFDPYLSDSLAVKYAGTRFPHARLQAIPVPPERIGQVRLVLCTHGHTVT